MSEPVEQLSQGARALRLHRQIAAIWATGPGLQRLAAVNHSVIGMRMMVTSFTFFAIAGVLPGGALPVVRKIRRIARCYGVRPNFELSVQRYEPKWKERIIERCGDALGEHHIEKAIGRGIFSEQLAHRWRHRGECPTRSSATGYALQPSRR